MSLTGDEVEYEIEEELSLPLMDRPTGVVRPCAKDVVISCPTARSTAGEGGGDVGVGVSRGSRGRGRGGNGVVGVVDDDDDDASKCTSAIFALDVSCCDRNKCCFGCMDVFFFCGSN